MKQRKQMTTFLGWTLVWLMTMSCQGVKRNEISILPKPVQVHPQKGTFRLNDEVQIRADLETPRIKEIATLGVQMIAERTGLQLSLGKLDQPTDDEKVIVLQLIKATDLGNEGYALNITSKKIEIEANEPQGLLYGLQSLRQLLPTTMQTSVQLPCVRIFDYPRFAWRGLLLDVGRHFFGVKEVKRFINLMAMYKLNIFHWHLTEDQGWRIEIKKYPKLTQVGAWRKSVGFKRNQDRGLNSDDGKPYGGFYTQKEIKEVVEYARLRGITVVPEIEMPGHSSAALAAYPELFCFPKEQPQVLTEGGVSNGVYCAGKEATFHFLTDVLDEVLPLFPSKFIHIGGDEAPKQNWKRCPLCQKRIVVEGLKDEHQLQSYFIHRIERYLNTKGRRLLGWDEIMEGGLNKSATVMSWRGMSPGIEAAQQGHDVVMTPGSYTYINHPQSVNKVTQAQGDVLTMREVYEFNPVPKVLTKVEEQQRILGVEACQWSEGTPTPEVLEYKEYPRAIALAEVAWTQNDQKNWDDFYARFLQHIPQLDFYRVNYGPRSYDVAIKMYPDSLDGQMYAHFVTEVPTKVYYTLEGTTPDRTSAIANGKLLIKNDCKIKACAFRPDGSKARVTTREIVFHKALGKKVSYNVHYNDKHDGGGEYALTNGVFNQWQGFEKRNVDVVLDLGQLVTINEITTHWKYDIGDWVFRPLEVSYSFSKDGKNYRELYKSFHENKKNVYDKGILPLTQTFDQPLKTRFIQIKAKNQMVNPIWHGSAGGASWIFIDEILVR